MSTGDILIIITLIVGVILGILVWVNRKAMKKMGDHQDMINRSKQTTTIFVIDKKKSKITDVNMPKMVTEQMPKIYKFLKLYFVQAKIGPQILTLICDKKVFNAITVKKNVKVELAGIYIVNVVGMKTDKELKEIKKAKKAKEKEEKKNNSK
ncbi:hypothetical protein [[Clostridium] colinum]|uniref:hypothetical protein n=1 Tax=[Clostridium] colinum TaxID=36835 RepID=UPI002023BD33|nr:hypothetical protein [[Clostridium] colinum]